MRDKTSIKQIKTTPNRVKPACDLLTGFTNSPVKDGDTQIALQKLG